MESVTLWLILLFHSFARRTAMPNLNHESAILMGATGAVGKHLVAQLLPSFAKLTVLTRRPQIDYEGPGKEKLVTLHTRRETD